MTLKSSRVSRIKQILVPGNPRQIYSICNYRGSPDSTVFVLPGNRIIPKTVLIGDWFSTKTLFMTFEISKSPFLLIFTRILIFETEKWLVCLFWHFYWEIYLKFWLLDKKFNIYGYFVHFLANKFLGLLH